MRATLLLCLLLVSCARPLTIEERSRIHSIGVISLLGDRITLDYTGLLEASLDAVPVPDTELDAVAENAAIECGKLGDPTREFKKIAIPKQPLMAKLYSSVLRVFDAPVSEIRPELSAWADGNHVDAIVVIKETYLKVPIGGPEHWFAGVGLHQFLSRPPTVQMAFGIIVLDGRSFQQIAGLNSPAPRMLYPESIQKVREQLTQGQHIPLAQILQRLLHDDVCKMIKAMNS